MPKLCFPSFDYKYQSSGQSLKIFDIIRKKYVALTPEEWVRQHLIHFLVNERKFPQSLLSVEKKVVVNNLGKRTDIVAYTSDLKPLLIAECKAPMVKLSQHAFDQAARYNMTIGVKCFIITNGLDVVCCSIDHGRQLYTEMAEIPDYTALKNMTLN